MPGSDGETLVVLLYDKPNFNDYSVRAYLNKSTHFQVVEVAHAVPFDAEIGEKQRDLKAGLRDDAHLAVGVLRVVAWPPRTDDTTARRR